jgi:hypothetical protein
MRKVPTLLGGVAVALGAALAAAQTPLLGPEIPVNTYTTGNQTFPAATIDPQGNFVLVWQSNGQDGDGQGVFGRRFDAAGTPLGSEFQVNTYTTGYQYRPKVAHDGSGNFVVVWQSYPQTGDDAGSIFGRRYDNAGNPLGGQFHVNTYTTNWQSHPSIAMSPSGKFIVAWESVGQDGDGPGVFAQRFDAAGAPEGNEFQVNTTTIGVQHDPAVAMTDLGSFVVVWSSGEFGTANYDVFGQRFNATGAAIGEEFQVDTRTGQKARQPAVAMDNDGDFAVAWTQYDTIDGDGDAVFARRFGESGDPEGAPVRANASNLSPFNPSVAFDATHEFIVCWNDAGDNPAQPGGLGIFAQRFGDPSVPVGSNFQVNVFSTGNQLFPSVAMNGNGNFVVAWQSQYLDGSNYGLAARRGEFHAAQPMQVDAHAPATGTQNLNGVLEPGETVQVEPAWMNTLGVDLADGVGTANDFTGPAGATYTLDDGAADYGIITAGATNDCFTATGNCYVMTVDAPAVRPGPHWDAAFTEAFSYGTKVWTLHVGESFPDVPRSQQFYKFIENLFHNGITGGCAGGNYCPDASVTRAQMAVFLLKSEHGSRYVPPPCAGVYPDVTCPSPFADWIEQLAAEGITGGCGSGLYCPDSPVTRQQMAVFLLKTKSGSAYTPPMCTGVFDDVACPSQFADWIEDLAGQGITGGCGNNDYCPTSPNTRGQMAVFLVKTFGLLLYGP